MRKSGVAVVLCGVFACGPQVPSWAGQYSPPSSNATGWRTPDVVTDDLWITTGWDWAAGCCEARAAAEAADARIWDPGKPAGTGHQGEGTAQASVTVSRQWVPDEGQDEEDTPEMIAGSVAAAITVVFNATCGEGAACSASAWGAAAAEGAVGGQHGACAAPDAGQRGSVAVPTADTPPLYTDGESYSDVLSLSAEIAGAGSVSVSAGCIAAAGASRETKEENQPIPMDDGLCVTASSAAVSL